MEGSCQEHEKAGERERGAGRMKKGKWIGRIKKTAALVLAVTVLCAAGVLTLPVRAAGNEPEVTALSQIMSAKESFDMKEMPEESAPTLMTYEKGDSVFVTGETSDGWYRIIYQDKTGYVKKEVLGEEEIDIEGIDSELAANAEETKFVVEAVERYRVDARRSKIWGSVIILLVAGIFAVGIISALKTQKDEKEKNNKKKKIQLEIEDLDLETK